MGTDPALRMVSHFAGLQMTSKKGAGIAPALRNPLDVRQMAMIFEVAKGVRNVISTQEGGRYVPFGKG